MPNNTRTQLLVEGRVWRILRILLFIPVFYGIWADRSESAAAFLAVVTLMGWYTSFQLKHQNLEKPYYQLWIYFAETTLSLAVMINVLIRNLVRQTDFHWILSVGCVFLLIRLLGTTIYGLSILHEGKKPRRPGFWSKAANLSITAAIMIYVLELEHFSQIAMVASILTMIASGMGYLYWFYRDPDHRKPLSVANQLTMSRIVLTPFFIWVFFYDNDLIYQNNHLIFKALTLFMVIAFMTTDFLDGYLARKMHDVSTLGKYLDPFSDKISNMIIFLCFMASGYAPIWMVATIYFRESSVETLRTLAANQGVVMPARRSGKWKTSIQGGGILMILAGALDPVHQWVPHWPEIWQFLPQSVMGIITFVTVASGIDYFFHSKKILQKYL